MPAHVVQGILPVNPAGIGLRFFPAAECVIAETFQPKIDLPAGIRKNTQSENVFAAAAFQHTAAERPVCGKPAAARTGDPARIVRAAFAFDRPTFLPAL